MTIYSRCFVVDSLHIILRIVWHHGTWPHVSLKKSTTMVGLYWFYNQDVDVFVWLAVGSSYIRIFWRAKDIILVMISNICPIRVDSDIPAIEVAKYWCLLVHGNLLLEKEKSSSYCWCRRICPFMRTVRRINVTTTFSWCLASVQGNMSGGDMPWIWEISIQKWWSKLLPLLGGICHRPWI